MQDMSENERGISCCGAAKALAVGSAIGGSLGAMGGGSFGTIAIGGNVLLGFDNALFACMSIGGSLGVTIGLLFAVGFLVHKSRRAYSNNVADIKQSKEDTNLLPAKNNVQAPRMYGMFPSSNGATNSDLHILAGNQTEGPGIFPSSNVQTQQNATNLKP